MLAHLPAPGPDTKSEEVFHGNRHSSQNAEHNRTVLSPALEVLSFKHCYGADAHGDHDAAEHLGETDEAVPECVVIPFPFVLVA